MTPVKRPRFARRRKLIPLGALAVLSFELALAAQTNQEPPELTNSFEVENPPFTVHYPDGWKVDAESFRNAIVFEKSKEIPLPIDPISGDSVTETVLATMFLWTEHRLDHSEAVQRLEQIAQDVKTPITFLEVSGWPAIQRRHLKALDVPVQEEDPTEEAEDAVLLITTAVAAGDYVVQLEAKLPPELEPELAAEVELIGASLDFEERVSPARPVKTSSGCAALSNLPWSHPARTSEEGPSMGTYFSPSPRLFPWKTFAQGICA